MAARNSLRRRLEVLDDRSVPAALAFSTTLTGQVFGMAVDAAGGTFVTAVNGTSRPVYEFDPAGNLLHSNPNVGLAGGGGIALDSAGNVYLQRAGNVIELDPTLQTVLFSETLPGATSSAFGDPRSGSSSGGSVAVAGGKIYVAGAARSGLPTTATAFQPAYAGTTATNAYLAVIDLTSPAPYRLTYCTYLGGSGASGDGATGVAVDGAGNAYLTGSTSSTNFPTTTGAFQRTFGGGHWDAFVAKINPAVAGAASLAYSTYLGGSGDDGYYRSSTQVNQPAESGPGIAVDAAGNAYVVGSTTSANFPVTVGAFQTTYRGFIDPSTKWPGGDAYVAKLNAAGSGLVYSTFLGGSDLDGASGIAVDAAGHAWVTGWTRSTDFPTAGALQGQKAPGTTGVYPRPNSDVFVTELNTDGSGVLFSTYWGGTADDGGMAIGLDASGDVFVAGLSGTGFPTSPGAYQTGGPGFLMKITP